MTLSLPWPPSILNPNDRSHWAKKAKHKKKYKEDCYYLTTPRYITGNDKIDLHITFHPPDKRKRDMDNMLASIKSGLDGVAMALGVDDNRFRLTLEIGEVIKHGCVDISIKV